MLKVLNRRWDRTDMKQERYTVAKVKAVNYFITSYLVITYYVTLFYYQQKGHTSKREYLNIRREMKRGNWSRLAEKMIEWVNIWQESNVKLVFYAGGPSNLAIIARM